MTNSEARYDNGRDDIQALEARHVLQTYRRLPVTFVRGQGVRLYDAEGREYLDLLSGIGVAALGHAHPGLARAHCGPGGDAASYLEPLLSPAPGTARRAPRQFLGPAARLLLQQRRRGGRSLFEIRAALLVHARRAAPEIHRARGIVSRPDLRRPVGDLRRALSRAIRAAVAGVRFVPVNNPAALLAAVSTATAAIIAEPIQGEGGVRPLTPAFAAAITEACEPHRRAAHRRRGAERSRPHRTSRSTPRHSASKPDLISVGKALGGGVPIGAALLSE